MTTPDAHADGDARAHDALERLRRFGGEELVQEMAAIFAETSRERIVDLRSALGRGDCGAMTRAAHSLKGSCAQIGAVAAQQLAHDLERNAESSEPEVLQSLIQRMEQECRRHEAWLASATERAEERT